MHRLLRAKTTLPPSSTNLALLNAALPPTPLMFGSRAWCAQLMRACSLFMRVRMCVCARTHCALACVCVHDSIADCVTSDTLFSNPCRASARRQVDSRTCAPRHPFPTHEGAVADCIPARWRQQLLVGHQVSGEIWTRWTLGSAVGRWFAKEAACSNARRPLVVFGIGAQRNIHRGHVRLVAVHFRLRCSCHVCVVPVRWRHSACLRPNEGDAAGDGARQFIIAIRTEFWRPAPILPPGLESHAEGLEPCLSCLHPALAQGRAPCMHALMHVKPAVTARHRGGRPAPNTAFGALGAPGGCGDRARTPSQRQVSG